VYEHLTPEELKAKAEELSEYLKDLKVEGQS
jgi:hypothetical protein